MKRYLAILLALIMLLAAFAGCNQKNPNETETEITTERTEPHTTEAPTEPTTTVAPTEPVTTEAPTEPVTTEAPTEPVTTEAPTEPVTTETPTEPVTTEAPTEPGTTEAPTEPETTEAPTEPETTEAPTEPETTEAPTEPVTTEAPTEPETTEATETTETETDLVFNIELDGAYVTCDESLSGIADDLADRLTKLSGHEIAYGTTGAGINIALSVNAASGNVSDTYSLAFANSVLTINAANPATLAFAIGDAMTRLHTEDIEEGYSEQHTMTFKTANATDTKLFKYCGTWQASDSNNPTTMVSYWKVAYVEVNFTGNAITLLFSSPTSFKYKIDNGSYVAANNINGEYTVMASGSGEHTVQIYCASLGAHVYFAGVKTEQSFTLSRTADKKHYIQFIGDSITTDGRSFSHNSANLLGWDYSVTSISGISLVKDKGYWRNNNGWSWVNGDVWAEGSMADLLYKNFGCKSIGMEDAFFKLGIPNFGSTAPQTPSAEFTDMAENYFTDKYDFNFETGNTPDIVFIFLGTNDLGANSSTDEVDTFVKTYKSFIRKILAKYGSDTEICIMQSLTSAIGGASNDPNYGPGRPRVRAIERVANELSLAGYDNITYIDYQTIIEWDVEISDDSVHPSANGYATLTEKIAEFLEKTYK